MYKTYQKTNQWRKDRGRKEETRGKYYEYDKINALFTVNLVD
jgi:ribosomal protein L32E